MGIAVGRWPWFGQVGAVVAACLACLLVFELAWDAPRRERLAADRRTLDEKRLALERGRRAARRLPALVTAVDELDARLGRLRARLPARRDAAALLRRLESAATDAGLTMRAFVPQPAVERSWHAEWPIRLELSGTYQRLGAFFDRVRRFDRIINLQDIAVRALETPRPDETIAAECTALTFVVNDATTDAQAGGARAGGEAGPGGPAAAGSGNPERLGAPAGGEER